MKLKTFLDDSGLSHEAFAEKIGVSRTAVVRYCNGTRRPEWPVLEKIAEETGGHVKPEDFFGTEAA